MNSKTVEKIETFQKVFDKYYHCFLGFYEGYENSKHKYYLMHPELTENALELQTRFYSLPEAIQRRLIDAETNVFLHCDNIVDLHAFREFVCKKPSRFYKIATIAERVESELRLAKRMLEIDEAEAYEKIPARNYHFYRGWEQESSMMEEDRPKEKTEDINVQHEEIESVVDIKAEDGVFFDNMNRSLENGDNAISKAENIISKGVSIITILRNIITSMGVA